MSKRHRVLVLVVDDEPLIRIVAVDSLEDVGFTVLEAANADDALELLGTRDDVGVLFTDINMPGALDGIDLAKRVHALWPQIRIVVTSGRGLCEPLPGADRFLGKPYSSQELARIIEQVSDGE